MSKPSQKDFQKQVIKVLREVPDGDRGTEIAVVRWIVDGMAKSPQLINQEVYVDRIDRRRKYGKLKGMNVGDVKFLMNYGMDKILEILLDLNRPAKTGTPSGKDAAANDPMSSQVEEDVRSLCPLGPS